MDKLLAYLNSLPAAEREAFAGRCRTTVGYLRKAASVGQKISEGLCIRVGIESHGAVRPTDLRPDVDWDYLLAGLSSTIPVEHAGLMRTPHADRRNPGPPIQCPTPVADEAGQGATSA
jgi:DNA-binding transcriptional regulator YdaS (Cro superfamily)